MVKISKEVIQGLVASHNDLSGDEEEEQWIVGLWEEMQKNNPYVLEMCQSFLDALRHGPVDESNDPQDPIEVKLNGFILGASLMYQAFLRHYESEDFEKQFA